MSGYSQESRSDLNSDLLLKLNSSYQALRIFERAIESCRNGIVITDPNLPENPIVYVNPAFSELTGYAPEEILGRNCRFLQGQERDQPELGSLRDAVASGSSITVILRNFKKDGTLFWNELTVSPVYDAQGKLVNFVGVQNDVSARKEAEKRVSEFYSMISHELRTPLSSIRAALGLVEDGSAGPVNKEAQKLVRIACSNSDKLIRLINDILDLKKVEAGKFELYFQKVDPSKLLESVSDDVEQMAKEADISLVIQLESCPDFEADFHRLTQVLTNLVANAIKFSAKGETVILRAGPGRNGWMRFEVVDSGVGISQADQALLFQKFQQLDASDKRKRGGSGLGLAICRSIVELHKGEIGVESELAKGSTFWFEIPLKA